ncbi:aldo/keto reductase [Paracoccus aerodenitrificans]|uniref:aldo/keto reductase n=1 Tax=Paracoccus aerodenitrificans TaxID=3017781 RepID=UPI0022F05DC9|nr:aldo/keto reductase [Paracoccus aerodenitrificans]WBU63821.1 aldo/keto reductase [Paracoccus aerodenitrificans]
MNREKLGQSGLDVSAFCLGTMTFGNQTDESDAHAQLDRALDAGITFLDCAEMYPVNPVRTETVGRSEEYIGNWLARIGRRDKVEIATKITGDSAVVRDGEGITYDSVLRCVEDSLRRLQTDVIDLYQLHWPMRGSYNFRQNWNYDPSGQDRRQNIDHFQEILRAMDTVIHEGKVRHFGLSNETVWGTLRWIDTAERQDAARVVSVQNEYSLICRLYDTDFAELAVNEKVTLLAYSPLAAGLLTGKYQNGAIPEGSRMAADIASGGKGNLGGRKSARVFDAVAAYHDLAREYGIDPVHMALAWLKTRPFPVVPILGATSLSQLEHQLAGLDTAIPDDLRTAIDDLHRAWPMPY